MSFNADNASIKYYGRAADNGFGYFPFDKWTECVIVPNSTDCVLKLRGTATTGIFEISIDGAAYSAITLSASGANVDYMAYTGLSAGEHVVKLRSVAAGADVGYAVIASFITLTGGAGTIRAPGAAEGYGPYAILNSGATYIDIGSYGQVTGSLFHTPTNLQGNFPDSRFRVRGQGDTLKIFVFKGGGKFAWEVDDVRQGTFTVPNDAEAGWYTVGIGLGGLPGTYGVTSAGGASSYSVDGVMFVGYPLDDTAAFSASAPPARTRSAAGGDSITAASVIGDSTVSWLYKRALADGANPFNRGNPGDKVANLLARITDLTGISPEPDILYLLIGTNDLTAGTTIGDAATAGTWTGDVKSVLNACIAAFTNTQFVWLRILPRTDKTPNQLKVYDDGADVAIAACSDPTRVTVIPMDGVVGQNNGAGSNYTDPNSDMSDGLHLTATGTPKVAAALSPVDTTPPTVTLATTGPTLVMTPSEAITGVTAGMLTVAGHTITGVSGSGAGPYTFTQTPPFAQGEVATGDFTAANTVFDTAAAPNAMATFTGKAIANTSTLTVPGAPTLTVDEVEPAESGTLVAPEAPASDGGSAIIAYEVWRKRNAGTYQLVKTIAAANLGDHWLDAGTVVGDDVFYKVRCYNAVGYSSFSAEQEVTSQGPPYSPVALLFDEDDA